LTSSNPRVEQTEERQGNGALGSLVSAVKVALLSSGFALFGAYWIKYSSVLRQTCQVGEAVPPVPAMATLLFLVIAKLILDRLRLNRWLSHKELLATYVFVTIATVLPSIGAVRFLFSAITTPTYLRHQKTMAEILPHLPKWLALQNEEIVDAMYYGWEGGRVPWDEWAAPLMFWTLFLGAFLLTTGFIMGLLYRRWAEDERLRFPIATMALELAKTEQKGTGTAILLRDPLFWVGVGVVGIYNMFFMLPAIFPSLGTPPEHQQINIAAYFTTPPWSAGGQWYIRFNPMIFGLGYLVSTDVLLTIWATVVILKLEAVFMCSLGAPEYPLFHIKEQQGVGAFFALALVMLWAGRRRIWEAAAGLVPARSARSSSARPATGSLLGAIAGTALLFWLLCRCGMPPQLAALFLSYLLVSSLVQARIRAQSGVPRIWMLPWAAHVFPFVLGGGILFAWGGTRGVAVFALMAWMLNSYITAVPSYQMDALFIAEKSGIKKGHMMLVTAAAVLAGLALTYHTHLPAFYEHGAANINLPKAHYLGSVYEQAKEQSDPNMFRAFLISLGFITTCLLAIMRSRLFWLPLHPVGFAAGCVGGARLFAPILVIWLIKVAVLKWAGGGWYRRLWPLFLGIVIGHFFIAGVLWGGLSMTGIEMFERYKVGFW